MRYIPIGYRLFGAVLGYGVRLRTRRCRVRFPVMAFPCNTSTCYGPSTLPLVYVFSASVPLPYVTTHLRTSAQLEQVVTAQSTINPYGSYVVPETIDIGGFPLKPARDGLLPALMRKQESLHFGYVTQWEIYRRAVYTRQVLCYVDTSIPRQFLMYPRFTYVDSGHV
jgi:hypothetical protein